jgi:hypothetical protein
MFNQKIQKDFVRVIKRGSKEDDDTLFWLTKTPLERLTALEEIRKSYNDWKYGIERGFQRVYKIIKRQQS